MGVAGDTKDMVNLYQFFHPSIICQTCGHMEPVLNYQIYNGNCNIHLIMNYPLIYK